MTKQIHLGVFGLGTVGAGLVTIIEDRQAQLAKTHGIELNVARAVVRDPQKARNCNTRQMAISSNPDDILNDERLDIVVELIGGTGLAETIVRSSLESGRPVVSANKALLAESGDALLSLAAAKRVPFFAEAAVGGGIPILKTLRESMVANEIFQLTAIINGTTNFVLTKMEEDGLSYTQALDIASELGFAEADPTMDVEGIDAAQKLRIMAAHILNGQWPKGSIQTEGISRITSHDFSFAKKHGYSIKLLAIAKRLENAMELRVHPTLIPRLHPLASVRNEFNAVYINGSAVGELMLSGKGAGALPTASAVYADIVDICTHKSKIAHIAEANSIPLPILDADEIETEYFLCFTVLDKPGVIGEVSSVLGRHEISVSSVGAELIPNADGLGMLDVIVHRTKEKRIRAAMQEINQLSRIQNDGNFMRIENNLS